MTMEKFCREFGITSEQFFGREIIKKNLYLGRLEYFPEGCSLKATGYIYLDSLKVLPEGCTLKSTDWIALDSLEVLPERYFIDARKVSCRIILPNFKGSTEFYFGEWSKKKYFKDYEYIKESPLKYIRSEKELERKLAKYFLNELER